MNYSNRHRYKYLKNTLLTSLCFTFVLLSFSSSIFAQIEDDDEIIEVDSSVVVLNAAITDDNGDVINGLNKDQFEIYEDGVLQEVAFFESKETAFAAVVLIDTSGSMENRVSLARGATIKFLEGIRVDDNVAIYNFDSKVSLVQDFSNLRDLRPQVFDLKSNGWTVMNDAIFEAATKLEKRSEKRKAIVVLSDGADTKSGLSSHKALKAALKANATIYTVDMSAVNSRNRSTLQNRQVLKKFADKTGGKFVKTPGGSAMRDAFVSIVKDLGVQYTIGYYPQNSKKDGKWRKVELRVKDRKLNIRTREGYNAPKK